MTNRESMHQGRGVGAHAPPEVRPDFTLRWLRRRGLIDERAAEERSNEAPALSPL
jgi:hypothetical protein